MAILQVQCMACFRQRVIALGYGIFGLRAVVSITDEIPEPARD